MYQWDQKFLSSRAIGRRPQLYGETEKRTVKTGRKQRFLRDSAKRFAHLIMRIIHREIERRAVSDRNQWQRWNDHLIDQISLTTFYFYFCFVLYF